MRVQKTNENNNIFANKYENIASSTISMKPDYLLHASSLSSCLEREQCQLGLHEYQIQAASFQGKKKHIKTKAD